MASGKPVKPSTQATKTSLIPHSSAQLASVKIRMGFVVNRTEPADCPRVEFALLVYKVPTVVGWKPGIILLSALFLKYFEPMLSKVLQNWAEHLSIALIVAIFIALTYEYISHLFREEILKNHLYESQERVCQALKTYSVLTHLMKFFVY